MDQLYLDPNLTSEYQGEWIPPGPIPSNVRLFSFYPDVASLLPGDLILVRNLKPNWTHKVIEKVQRTGGYAEKDYRWHHAAVCLGEEGDICEADINGVTCSSINRYCTGQHLIRVRRDETLDPEQRSHIAIRSLTRLNQSYAFFYLIKILLMAYDGFDKININSNSTSYKSTICSQHYRDSYSPITGKVLQNSRSGEITPAFLSASNLLTDVPLTWKKIAGQSG